MTRQCREHVGGLCARLPYRASQNCTEHHVRPRGVAYTQCMRRCAFGEFGIAYSNCRKHILDPRGPKSLDRTFDVRAADRSCRGEAGLVYRFTELAQKADLAPVLGSSRAQTADVAYQ